MTALLFVRITNQFSDDELGQTYRVDANAGDVIEKDLRKMIRISHVNKLECAFYYFDRIVIN